MVTYWAQVDRGGGGSWPGGGARVGEAVPVAKVPLPLSHQCSLVLLHALQLLLSAHAAPWLAAAHWQDLLGVGIQTLQGTPGPLLGSD